MDKKTGTQMDTEVRAIGRIQRILRELGPEGARRVATYIHDRAILTDAPAPPPDPRQTALPLSGTNHQA